MMRAHAMAGSALALALGACSLAPKYVAPELPVPQSWPVGDVYLAQSEATLPVVSYRDIFRDTRLQQLIERALENNRDVRIAAANLAAARAQVRLVRSAQFPELNATAGATYSEAGTGNAGVNNPNNPGQTVNSRNGWFYSAQGGVSSFELDLFGRLANATESQRYTALATEASARTVRLSLVADLAQAWATYASDRDLLAVAEATARIAERSVELTRARLQGGIAPRTDLRQAEQVLETARGDVAQQRTALAQDANVVRLLVGAEFDQGLLPGTISEVIDTFTAAPAGTSSQVLLRRPDVIEAEYGLRSANADIGVARAQLFPSISLTGLAGFASTALSSLFTGGAFRWSAGPSVSYSVFNAGGRVANVEVTQAQRDAALATYERAIQIAFREVSDALADQGTLAERLRSARANTAAAEDTVRLTEARYRYGVEGFLSNLDAQRSLYTARRSEIATRLASATNRVTLYRVLGGDAATATPSVSPR